MKAALKILLIGAALFFWGRAGASSDGYDVFNPIVKYFGQGNVDKLSAWFADNLEVSILSTNNDCSKNQAKQILKTFFSNHNPRSMDIIHTASKANSKYALGELNAGGEVVEEGRGDGVPLRAVQARRGVQERLWRKAG